MEHRGFTCTPKFDDSQKLFHGKVVTPQGTLLLRAPSMEELQSKFIRTIDQYRQTFSDDLQPSRYPSLRRRIFGGYLAIIVVMGAALAALLWALASASAFPRSVIVHNYDSIVYAAEMREAWYRVSGATGDEAGSAAAAQRFESYLAKAEGNITEPGEPEILRNIRSRWSQFKSSGTVDDTGREALHAALDELVKVNERGMQNLVGRAEQLRKDTVLWSTLAMTLAAVVILALAFKLADRVTRPLRAVSDALRSSGVGDRPSLRGFNPESEELSLVMEALELRFINEAVEVDPDVLDEDIRRLSFGDGRAAND